MSKPEPKPTVSASRRPLDRREFAALFQEAYGRLWVLAVGILGDRHAADDIVQDSAVAALAKLDQFEPGSNFHAWLGRFVRWHAFNYTRKLSTRGTLPADPRMLDLGLAPPDSPEIHLESDLAGQILDDQPHFDDGVVAALRAVPPVGRACLLLRTVHQLPYRDIAAMLDIPEGTAMSHVHRSRQTMRDRLRGSRPADKFESDHS